MVCLLILSFCRSPILPFFLSLPFFSHLLAFSPKESFGHLLAFGFMAKIILSFLSFYISALCNKIHTGTKGCAKNSSNLYARKASATNAYCTQWKKFRDIVFWTRPSKSGPIATSHSLSVTSRQFPNLIPSPFRQNSCIFNQSIRYWR